MRYDLLALFDECGEESFSEKASEWFILSAAIQPVPNRKKAISCYDDYRTKHRKQPTWAFHFQKQEHRARLAFIRDMKPAGYTFMSAIIHKPSIKRTDNFSKPYFLYFYAAKLILERISWHAQATGGKLTDLYFSTRGGLERDDVKRYIALLRNQTEPDLRNSIHWPSAPIKEVYVMDNKELIGLQMADLMASSIGQALVPHPYDVTEPRYLLELSDQIYRRKGSYLSYGLKFFPTLSDELKTHGRFDWLEELERQPKARPT